MNTKVTDKPEVRPSDPDVTSAPFTRFEVVVALSGLAMDLGVDFPSVGFNGSWAFELKADSYVELEAWMQVFDLKPEPNSDYWGYKHPNLPLLMYHQTSSDYKRWHGWCVSASGSQAIDELAASVTP